MTRNFKLPKPILGEQQLVVSKSQLYAMLASARAEANQVGPIPGSTAKTVNDLPVLEFDLPKGYSVLIVPDGITVIGEVANKSITIQAQKNGSDIERMFYTLAMYFLRLRRLEVH